MTLHSGERQVAETAKGVRADHVARYVFAAAALPAGSRIADIGCGTGYGCKILADAGHSVIGLDNDAETLEFAKAHYAADGIEYLQRDLSGWPKLGRTFDAAVCFETIEHLTDPKPMLRKIGCRRLLASVPNQSVYPFAGQKFHHRHYTMTEFMALLNACGWGVIGWYSQADTKADVKPGHNGWTLIADCVR